MYSLSPRLASRAVLSAAINLLIGVVSSKKALSCSLEGAAPSLQDSHRRNQGCTARRDYSAGAGQSLVGHG